MSALMTLGFFLVVIWGLGYSALAWLKQSDDLAEQIVMQLGVGLGVLVVLGTLLNLVGLPIDWRIFLVLSIIVPMYNMVFRRVLPSGTLDWKVLLFLVLILSSCLFVYTKGAFAYPWFEDSDPWDHAKTAKYIALEKTAFEPPGIEEDLFQYTDSYPPGYPILMGILLQVSDQTMWVLKFFNALLLSLGVLFFFFFVRRLSGDDWIAYVATIILAVIPSYMSHFIWSLTLSVLLYFVSFYALESTRIDKRWWIVAGVVMSAILMTQVTTAVKFAMFLGAIWVARAIRTRSMNWHMIGAGALAAVIAISLWWAPVFMSWGYPDVVTVGLYQYTTDNVFDPARTAFFTIGDFFSAPMENRINNPIGVGPVLFPLFLLTLAIYVWKRRQIAKTDWRIGLALWSILAFLMIHGSRLPYRLDPHRSWMLFAIPVSIIAADGILLIAKNVRSFKVPKHLAVIGLLALVVLTCAPAKYAVNTAVWPHDGSMTSDDIGAYVWMQSNLPAGSMVFAFYNYEKIIAYDMVSVPWSVEEHEFRKTVVGKSPDEIVDWAKIGGYEYLFLDAGNMLRSQVINVTQVNELANGLAQLTRPVFSNDGNVIYQLI